MIMRDVLGLRKSVNNASSLPFVTVSTVGGLVFNKS